VHALAQRLVDGDVRALARVCRLVDDAVGDYRQILKDLFPHSGHAWTIGITGTPGAGKSTLTDKLIANFRESGDRVAVICIDPTSPFSGGAILGDRIRMQRHHSDRGVFIRSVATRGTLGGLSRSAPDMIRAVDAWRPGVILVETVGVGQDEVDIVRTADAVAVVLVPGMGDDIQAIKAGILEIADLFVINKADREGADRLHADLESMLSLAPEAERPRPSIHRTVALTNQGVGELLQAIRDFFRDTESVRHEKRRADRAESRFLSLLEEQLTSHVLAQALPHDAMRQLVARIAQREIDPYTAVRETVARLEVR